MSTRGFVGYQLHGTIRGWYNHFDSYYSELGLAVLDKFERHPQAELTDFFTKRLELLPDNDCQSRHSYKIYHSVFNLNWATDCLILADNSQFLYNGLFCEYGYVFDLDNDELQVYRGFFTRPQYTGQPCSNDNSNGKKYYTHHVLTVTRDNIAAARLLFTIYHRFPDWFLELYLPYPERALLPAIAGKQRSDDIENTTGLDNLLKEIAGAEF